MRALWDDDVKSEGTSRITWEIEPVGDSCRLTVVHDELREGANEQLYGGWPMILSGLKTWLETGKVLTTPGSLMYAPSGTGSPGLPTPTERGGGACPGRAHAWRSNRREIPKIGRASVQERVVQYVSIT